MIQVARYFGVGAVAAFIDISLFWFFAGYLGFHYMIVGTLSFILATATNYVLSIRYVFESGVRFARHHEVMLVFFVSAVGLVLNQSVLFVCIGLLQSNLLLSKILATAMVFVWNYNARSRFIFKSRCE